MWLSVTRLTNEIWKCSRCSYLSTMKGHRWVWPTETERNHDRFSPVRSYLKDGRWCSHMKRNIYWSKSRTFHASDKKKNKTDQPQKAKKNSIILEFFMDTRAALHILVLLLTPTASSRSCSSAALLFLFCSPLSSTSAGIRTDTSLETSSWVTGLSKQASSPMEEEEEEEEVVGSADLVTVGTALKVMKPIRMTTRETR